MECNVCHRLMVSLYVNKYKSISKNKKSIGKICLKCGMVQSATPYFQELKREIVKEDEVKQNEQGYRKRPEFHGIEVPICDKMIGQKRCNSKLHEKKSFPPFWQEYPNSDGSTNYQLNNPYIEFICKKCKNKRTVGLPMPFPIPKKYRTPPKN